LAPFGTAWHALVERLFRRWEPNRFQTVLMKTIAEQILFAPAINAAYIVLLGLLQGNSFHVVRSDLYAKFGQVTRGSVAFWAPSNLISHRFVPQGFRILYSKLMSVLWMVFLIGKASSTSADEATNSTSLTDHATQGQRSQSKVDPAAASGAVGPPEDLVAPRWHGLPKLRWCCRTRARRTGRGAALSADSASSKQDEVASAPRHGQAHLSKISHADSRSNGAGMPLVELVRTGRLVEAYRQLCRLEERGDMPQKFLDDTSIEQVRRVAASYESALDVLGLQVSDLPLHAVSTVVPALQWGAAIEEHLVRVVGFRTLPDIDIVRVIAAKLETDMQAHISDEFVRTEVVGPYNYYSWIERKLSHVRAVRQKTDEVTEQCFVDALDEPNGSLWYMFQSPSPEAMARKEVHGVPIPEPEPGFVRLPHSRAVTVWRPLGNGGDVAQGVSVVTYIEAVPLPAMYRIVKFLPSFAKKSALRKAIEAESRAFEAMARNNEELDERIRTGPRAPLYRMIRSHLLEKQRPAARHEP